MLIVPITEARVGMKLAAPVLHPEHQQQLLRVGYVLEGTIVSRLTELGVDLLYVEYPGLDELDKHLQPFLSPARQQMCTQIKKAFTNSQKATRPEISYADYCSGVTDLIGTLMEQGRHPVFMDQMSRLGNDSVGHAAAVCHLALLIGIKVESYLIEQRKRLSPQHAKSVVNLGVAGMLHDIGKMKLPEHLQNCHGLSEFKTDSDRKEFETHCRLGYDMLHDHVEVTAATAVLHHHQHFDGSGFPPLGAPGEDKRILDTTNIHIFSRILQIADLYDHLSTPANSKRRRSNLEILHLMRTQYAPWCDPVLLQTLHTITPPYPPGSRLKLSDGSLAVVTEVDSARPFHPTVKRLAADHWSMEETAVNLKDPSAPTIVTIGDMSVEPFLPTTDVMRVAV